MTIKKIAIVGTGTDVGKTVFSCLMMQTLFSMDCNPLYLKPFQTGCDGPGSPDTDAAFIYKQVAQLQKMNPTDSIINCHTPAKAPYFAAKDMGQVIDIDHTLKIVEDKISGLVSGQPVSHVVMEAAGGLMVPLTDTELVLDFIVQSSATPVLVAQAGLGTINHTLLSIEQLKQKNISPACVVLMDTCKEGTNPDMVLENKGAIELFSGIPVVGVIPYMKNISPISKENFEIIIAVLDRI